MDRPLLVVLVDAFRHDYLDPARAPFLAAVAERSTSARMRPILGYSDSIRATIFTGAYPDEHGYWMEYCRRPSPMAPLARLAPLDRMPNDFVRRGMKFVLSQTVAPRLAARHGYAHLSLRHMPFRGLGQFDWTLRTDMTADGALGMPTVFDDLTAAGVPWRYLDASKGGRRAFLRGLDGIGPDTKLVFAYLHHIDMASHVLGVDGRLFGQVVRRTDALVEDVVGRVQRRLGDVDLLVFSDHGMSNVERIVSYPDLWTHPAFPDRFSFALDATMVRLWFDDADDVLRDELRARVAAGAPGRWLDRDELAALHLDFEHRLYGDEIYLLEPRTAIFPNFHSMLKPRAMHAYHPDDLDQHGIFLSPLAEPKGETVELTEVTAVIRRQCGLGAAQALAA